MGRASAAAWHVANKLTAGLFWKAATRFSAGIDRQLSVPKSARTMPDSCCARDWINLRSSAPLMVKAEPMASPSEEVSVPSSHSWTHVKRPSLAKALAMPSSAPLSNKKVVSPASSAVVRTVFSLVRIQTVFPPLSGEDDATAITEHIARDVLGRETSPPAAERPRSRRAVISPVRVHSGEDSIALLLVSPEIIYGPLSGLGPGKD
mmetsp:Transcript_47257/g.118318  ORF Transcript_47257/g.118318 Transcript_47257/m.118318 type:complete len:206 (+) Transcript_47257:809-1426(+)